MTVNQKLAQIIERLDRIERTMKRSSSNQIVSPCCQPINNPATGNPIPVLPPPPVAITPGVDLACARMYAMLKRKVDGWNWIWYDSDEWVYAGATGLFQAILTKLGQWVAPYMSLAHLGQMYINFMEKVDQIFRIEDVNYCTAARQALEQTDVMAIPDEIWDHVHPLDRAGFLVYWRLTGGLQGYETLDPEPDVSPGCCLPDTFQLLPVVRTLTCGSDSYDLDVIGASDPPEIAQQVIVNPAGIPHIYRGSIGGMWVRNVQGVGAFGLWGYYSDSVTNDGCNYLRSIDFEMTNMTWNLVTITGSPFIVFRNRVSGENSILEVSRTEPGDWNGVDTI